MTKRHRLPTVTIPEDKHKRTLPYNGLAVKEKGFSFSFACFDRTHKLFNLGDSTPDKVISGKWFLDLLDCLKDVNNKTIPELRCDSHDLHPVDWSTANTSPPPNADQLEFWQFRVNKSRGRIIGFMTHNVFYIVWLDPHHNLTDAEGYEKATEYTAPKSEYESLMEHCALLEKELEKRTADLNAAEELLEKE